MTTITIERSLLERALAALTYKGTMGPTRRQRRMAAVEALRAALAAPATAPAHTEAEVQEVVRLGLFIHTASCKEEVAMASLEQEDAIRRILGVPAP